MLETQQLTWSSVKTRLDQLKWLQRFVDQRGDVGPVLVTDIADLRDYTRAFAAALRDHVVLSGRTKGKPLSKNVRRSTMVALEQFFRHMYDHREKAAQVLDEHRWLKLEPLHTVVFLPSDKPRLTNMVPDDKVLQPTVLSQIITGSELLGRPVAEGGLGDIQAFHALALLVRTGRRMNEVLMMDFDPLLPLMGARLDDETDLDDGALIARLRYQLTKIESSEISPTIPVDAEIVRIVLAQQEVAREIMRRHGSTAEPKYLFLRTRTNRLGTFPVRSGNLHEQVERIGKGPRPARQPWRSGTHHEDPSVPPHKGH
ncbi:hypothetical protein GCM10028801_10270 [Nocardioides maradonensis]